ncbi:MAG: hypothetical protein EXQ95_13465 [Alphaproteobacteria bacterium]|nr:hypothetical protein [Alphaproteobacteria bacterium]
MSASAALVVRSVAVGHRTCTITIGQPDPRSKISPAVAEWMPTVPKSRLPAHEQRQFEAGRHAALVELGQTLGGNVALIERIAEPPTGADGA